MYTNAGPGLEASDSKTQLNEENKNKNKKFVKNGIRTHALSDQYLKLAP